MAAPESARVEFTDTELSALVGKLKPEDIDALSDDEVKRLDRLTQPNRPAEDPTATNPLAGKPTLAEFERNKVVAETPRMGLPTGRTQTPPLPQEGPTDLKSFLLSIGRTVTGGASREAPAIEMPKTVEHQAGPSIGDTQLVDPLKAQEALIGRNQPEQLLTGGSPSFVAGQPSVLANITARAVPAVIKDVIDSTSQFLLDPTTQFATRPLEFGMNVLQAGLWLRGARAAVGAARATPEAIDAAASSIRAAAPEQIVGAQVELDKKIAEIDHAKDAVRELFGGDPEYMGRLRQMEKDLEEVKTSIAKIKGPLPDSEPVLEPASLVSAGPRQVPTTNVVRPLREHGDTLYRETNLDNALDFIAENNSSTNMQGEVHMATTPDLALGQGSNKGVTIELDPSDLQGKLTQKPGWEARYETGSSEVVGKYNDQEQYRRAVRSITISGDAVASKVAKARFRSQTLPRMLKNGWVKTDLPGGGMKLTRPGAGLLAPTEATATAQATVKLPQALALTGPGGVLLAGAAEDDKADPTPRVGGPFGVKHPILTAAAVAGGAGILGYGAFRYFKAVDWPEFLAEAKVYTRFDKTREQDLYKLFETVVAPIFPDTKAGIEPNTVKGLVTLAGAGAGFAVGSKAGRDEFNWPGAIGGGVVGAITGSVYGRSLMRSLQSDKTWQQLVKVWFREGGMLPEAAYAKQKELRIAKEGFVREIKDVTAEYTKFPVEVQGNMQAFMSGNLAGDQLPAVARVAAEKMRFLLDEMSVGALKVGMIEDPAMQQVYIKNLGTYVPGMYLRYELDDLPQVIVDNWLRANNKGWGYLSPQNYNIAKKALPQDVKDAYGEITANPSYLLARRGVVVAADIEHAKYQNFVLSSPDFSIPDDVLSEGQKANAAYKKLRVEDMFANKATDLLRKQDIGQVAEGDEATKLAVAAQQKAEKGLGPTTIARTYEYLSPDSPHPKFFSEKDGLDAAHWNDRTYWKIPDNKRYGKLRGHYVEANIASDMMGVSEIAQGLSNPILGSILSSWKFTKAVFNFASLFRNNFTNIMFADTKAGIGFGPWHWARWYRGFNDTRDTGSYWYKFARKSGTYGGEFTRSEMMKYLEPAVGDSTDMMDFVGRSLPEMLQKAADFPADKAIQYHQFSEAWARTVVFRKAVEKMGMDGPAAAAFARRTIPDYQDVPRWVTVMRRSVFGAPFISFNYKGIPLSLEAAFAFGDPKRFFGFWKYPFALGAFTEYTVQHYGMLGKDQKTDAVGTIKRLLGRGFSAGFYHPDQWNTLQKYLPGYVGALQAWLPGAGDKYGKWLKVVFPGIDAFDRPSAYDATFNFTYGNMGEMGTGQVGQSLGIPFLPAMLEPSNPYFQLGVGIVTGKDSFTGKQIIPDGAVGFERAAAMGQYLMRMGGASLQPGAGYAAESLTRSFSGDYAGSPNVKTPGAAVVSDIFGHRVRPVDAATAYPMKYFEMKHKLDAARSEIHSAARNLPLDVELTKPVIDGMLANKPSAQLVRAINHYIAIAKEFAEKFPTVPPPNPKIVEAQKRGKK